MKKKQLKLDWDTTTGDAVSYRCMDGEWFSSNLQSPWDLNKQTGTHTEVLTKALKEWKLHEDKPLNITVDPLQFNVDYNLCKDNNHYVLRDLRKQKDVSYVVQPDKLLATLDQLSTPPHRIKLPVQKQGVDLSP